MCKLTHNFTASANCKPTWCSLQKCKQDSFLTASHGCIGFYHIMRFITVIVYCALPVTLCTLSASASIQPFLHLLDFFYLKFINTYIHAAIFFAQPACILCLLMIYNVFHRALGWTISNCYITSNSSRCAGSNHCLHCVYINHTDPNSNEAIRTATTPPLDLRMVTGVTPPSAPTNHWIKCSGTSMYVSLSVY